MRSVLNKRADFSSGEIVAMIIAVAVIAITVYFIMYPTVFKSMVQNFLPNMNSTAENGYDVISGNDEEISLANARQIVNQELTRTPDKVTFSERAADICGYLGFGGTFGADYRSALTGDYQKDGIAEIESISLGVGATALVVDSKGQAIGNLVRSATDGAYNFFSGSKIVPASVNSFGKIMVNGKAIGTFAKAQEIKLVLKGGQIVTSKIGDDIIVSSAKAVPQLVSKAGRFFGFLSKGAVVAGYITSGVSVLCDLGAMFTATYDLSQSRIEFEESAQDADESLGNVVDSVQKNYESIYNQYSTKIRDSPYISSVDKSNISKTITDLLRTKTNLVELHGNYSSNSEMQPSGTLLQSIFPSGSQFSDREYLEIKAIVSKYISQSSALGELIRGVQLVDYYDYTSDDSVAYA